MLLVLDNCEHVIEAAAALAVDTLRGAPGVRPAASEAEALNFPADCSWNDEFELTDANAAIVAEM